MKNETAITTGVLKDCTSLFHVKDKSKDQKKLKIRSKRELVEIDDPI